MLPRFLRAIFGPFGRSWGRIGGILGPTWHPSGATNELLEPLPLGLPPKRERLSVQQQESFSRPGFNQSHNLLLGPEMTPGNTPWGHPGSCWDRLGTPWATPPAQMSVAANLKIWKNAATLLEGHIWTNWTMLGLCWDLSGTLWATPPAQIFFRSLYVLFASHFENYFCL